MVYQRAVRCYPDYDIGFCFSYLLFTAAVYFIFFRTGPGFGGIPSDYAMATMSTLAMVAAGLAVKKLIT